jgi:hypothetical protein
MTMRIVPFVLLLSLLASRSVVSPVQPGDRAIALPLILGGPVVNATPSETVAIPVEPPCSGVPGCPPEPTATSTATSTPTATPTHTRAPTPLPTQPTQPNCHPSYPDFCIPSPPPDLDCGSATVGGRKNFRVLEPDPHRLDGDTNGIGCEG